MGKRTSDIFEEVLENIRDDRVKVQGIRDKVIASTGEDIMSVEPLAVLGIAESVVKLSDVLTKMNMQLVELAKLSSRGDRDKESPKIDNDDIFDVIEAAEQDPEQAPS